MPTSAQVAVTTTATVVVAATAFDQTVYLHSLGPLAVYLGGSNVTISNGYKMDLDDKLTITVGDHEPLYAITGLGTVTLTVLTQIN